MKYLYLILVTAVIIYLLYGMFVVALAGARIVNKVLEKDGKGL